MDSYSILSCFGKVFPVQVKGWHLGESQEQILSCLLTWIQMELSWTAPMNENVYTNISLGFVIVLSFCFPVSRCISTARCDCIYMTTLMVWLVPCKEVAKVNYVKKFEDEYLNIASLKASLEGKKTYLNQYWSQFSIVFKTCVEIPKRRQLWRWNWELQIILCFLKSVPHWKILRINQSGSTEYRIKSSCYVSVMATVR